VHDVLDPADLVVDEAEQLALTGHQVDDLAAQARAAADTRDLEQLAVVAAALKSRPRNSSWAYEEPEDDGTLLTIAQGAPIHEVDPVALPDRIRGAWLGRTVGNTLGKPVEGLTRAEMATYLLAAGQRPQTGYLPLLDPLPTGVRALHPSAPVACAGRFTDVPRDDDIDWTILALHLVETHGRGFTTDQVAAAWLDRMPFTQTYTAERAAYRNLVERRRPPQTATHENPYREWIGALIRTDLYGYICPGQPAEAARMALTDARLSHTGNGKYGAVWAAALTAAALAADTAHAAYDHALSVVPPGSRLREVLQGVIDLHQAGATDEEALDWVDATLGHYPWVHTLNNAALISIGLLWRDTFIGAVALTISGGRDTDSNAATVGSVMGAIHGTAGIPVDLVGSSHIHVRSAVRDFDRVTIDELTSRTLALTRAPVASPEATR
jgi:ADP-ribosylglycohydrolase